MQNFKILSLSKNPFISSRAKICYHALIGKAHRNCFASKIFFVLKCSAFVRMPNPKTLGSCPRAA